MAKSGTAGVSLPDIYLPPISKPNFQTSRTTKARPLPEYTLPDPSSIPDVSYNSTTLNQGDHAAQSGDLSSGQLIGPEGEATTLGDFKMCVICNISLNSKSQADMHYGGKTHQRKLKQIDRAESFAPGSDVTEAPVDNAASSSDNTADEEKNITDMFLPHCDICQLSLTGISQVEMHLTGAKHAKKLRQLAEKHKVEVPQEEGPTSTKVPESYYCKPCEAVCTSQAQLNQHFQGTKHKNVMEGISNSATDRPAAPVQSKNPIPSEVVMASFVCSTCSISANSEQQYLQHLGSTKHSNKLRNRDGKDKYRDHPYPKRQDNKGKPNSNYNSQNSGSSWGNNNNWSSNKWQGGGNDQNGSSDSWGRGGGRGRGRGGQGRGRGGQDRGRGGQDRGRGGQDRGRGGQDRGRGGQDRGRFGQGRGRGGQGVGRGGQASSRGWQASGRGAQRTGGGGQSSNRGWQSSTRGGQGSDRGGQTLNKGRQSSNQSWQTSQTPQNQLHDNTMDYSSSYGDTETTTNAYAYQFPVETSSYASKYDTSAAGYQWSSQTLASGSLQSGAGEKGSWPASLSQSKTESGADSTDDWYQTNYQRFAINYAKPSATTTD